MATITNSKQSRRYAKDGTPNMNLRLVCPTIPTPNAVFTYVKEALPSVSLGFVHRNLRRNMWDGSFSCTVTQEDRDKMLSRFTREANLEIVASDYFVTPRMTEGADTRNISLHVSIPKGISSNHHLLNTFFKKTIDNMNVFLSSWKGYSIGATRLSRKFSKSVRIYLVTPRGDHGERGQLPDDAIFVLAAVQRAITGCPFPDTTNSYFIHANWTRVFDTPSEPVPTSD